MVAGGSGAARTGVPRARPSTARALPSRTKISRRPWEPRIAPRPFLRLRVGRHHRDEHIADPDADGAGPEPGQVRRDDRRDGIAEAVGADDLAEHLPPLRVARGLHPDQIGDDRAESLERHPARQVRGRRREDVAAVEGRADLGQPVTGRLDRDRPPVALEREREEAVVRPHVVVPACAHGEGAAPAAHARIDDGQMHRPGGRSGGPLPARGAPRGRRAGPPGGSGRRRRPRDRSRG